MQPTRWLQPTWEWSRPSRRWARQRQDGKTKWTIQIKSLTKAVAVPLGTSLKKIMGDFWSIVNSLGSGQPRTYILLRNEVRER